MAINACSINGFTLNGRSCSDKFAALIPILHPIVPSTSTGSGSGRVLRDTFKFPHQFEIDDKTLTFEQPIVTVSVEFMGMTGSDTQDVSASQMDFVTVTNFEIDSRKVDSIISVNISDLTFE